MTDKEICCEIECPQFAEFEVLTRRWDVQRWAEIPAGPDPYSDSTFACRQHVGELLAWQPEVSNPEDVYWRVEPIDDV